jgi:hypothetical protein
MNNNKLIAEFMGGGEFRTNRQGVEFVEFIPLGEWKVEDLPYHTEWNWLMPVANEIIKSRDEQNEDWDLTNLKYALCTTNIEYVYKAVVEFIKDQVCHVDLKEWEKENNISN